VYDMDVVRPLTLQVLRDDLSAIARNYFGRPLDPA